MPENPQLVSYNVDGPVAVIRLERPDKLNAVTFTMINDIRTQVERASADDQVVGIVITGTGRGFSAGLDMEDLTKSTSGMAPATTTERAPDPDELPALFGFLPRIPKPVIGAINGVCAGGGFVLAMMCDVRFAAERSARFTTAFGKRGLVAEHGTSWLLPRLVGTSRALDLLWSSRTIDAAEAYRIGFVDRLVDDNELLNAATAYIRDMAAAVAPRSIALMKAQVYRGWSQPIDVALSQVQDEVNASLVHPDSTEGVVSFLEKRSPRFAPIDNRPGRIV